MSANVADAKQIFLEAVEKHEPERWPGFLDDACGTDSLLRERVEALLAAYRQPNRILSVPEPISVLLLSLGLAIVIPRRCVVQRRERWDFSHNRAIEWSD